MAKRILVQAGVHGPHPEGQYVKYEDYAALEAKYLELAGWVLDAPCDHATEELAKEALGK